MAVAPTGAIYKALEFDGVSSRTYGVYITGEAVYNAPERDVEMITIPGRSGSFALDNGRFENITVSYPAGIFAETEADFREAVSEFRNFLCSRKGYVRLQDEYNPNEYRMAVYKSGLEVEPAMLKAGEFEITFDCKPQRWLTSGETAITIGEWGETETATGDIVKIDNPDGTLGIKSLSVALDPIQSGSGTPSPDNVRPISGRTECVTIDDPMYGGYIEFNQLVGNNIRPSQTKNAVTFTNNDDGTFTMNGTADASDWWVATPYPNTDIVVGHKYFVSDANHSGVADKYGIGWSANPSTILLDDAIVTADAVSNAITYIYKSGAVINNAVFKPMLFDLTQMFGAGNEPTTVEEFKALFPHDYYEYNSGETTCVSAVNGEPYNTYTTALGRTVYGGTLDVVSGELVVTDGYIASYNGESLPSTWISDRDVYASGTVPTTGAQVVYKLATPQTYQLTPQEVSLITGTNNVWSDSGDITLEYGQLPNLLINPTLFESGPLLEVVGYGTIGFNGYEIELENAVMGDVLLADKKTSGLPTFYNDFSLASLNAGDTITVNGISVIFSIWRSGATISSVSDSNSDFSTTYKVNGNYYYFTTTLGSFTGQKGTYAGKTNTTTISGTNSNGAFTINVNCTLKLDNYYQQPNDGFCSIEYAYTDIVGHEFPTFNSSTCETIRGNSTMSLLGNPTYVDCDLGECYLINGGDVVSLNAYIDLGSKLPTLAPGSNTITFDNTITDLKIVPRWWRV